jgi:hypothetical protein
MTVWQDIRDGGRLLYDVAFLPAGEADTWLAWLCENVPWRQAFAYGHPLPAPVI